MKYKKIVVFIAVIFVNLIYSLNSADLFEKNNQINDITERIELLNKKFEAAPADFEICFELGIAYFQAGDLIKSDYYLSQAVKLKKKIIQQAKSFEERVEEEPSVIEPAVDGKKTELKQTKKVVEDIVIDLQPPKIDQALQKIINQINNDLYFQSIVEKIKNDMFEFNQTADAAAPEENTNYSPIYESINAGFDIKQIPSPPLPLTFVKEDNLINMNSDGMYDLNLITEAELEKIKGLTDIDKVVILHYREQYGDYYSIEDLENLPGLAAKMELVKKFFFVNPATRKNNNKTLAQKRLAANKDAVNLNTATAQDFIDKFGISELEASMIVKYRERYGNFKTIEELKNIPVVGEKYEILKNKLAID